MTNVTIGKRILPIAEIALVEAYEAKQESNIQSNKTFRARAVLLSRESLLIEETPEAFTKAHGFRPLPLDQAGLNPAVRFRVETFEPAENFTPTKPYVSRIRWHDLDGNDQSKLLLTEPEALLDVITGTTGATLPPGRSPGGSSRPRRARKSPRTQPAPAQT